MFPSRKTPMPLSSARPVRRAAAAVALPLLLSLAAPTVHAEIIDLRFDPQGRFEREVQVAPGKFVELCGALPAGAKVQWRYEAAAPLDFNIHYHVGKEVKFPAKAAAQPTAEGVLEADSAQDFCWMWTNKDKERPVRLQTRLQRSG